MRRNRKQNWKQIKEFPDYVVSDEGNVFSLFIKKDIALSTDKNGYQRAQLTNETGRHAIGVHRLVAQAFVLNYKNYPEVNHIDGNKENNFHENLEWCTRSGNMAHAVETGLVTHLFKLANSQKQAVIAYKNGIEFGKYSSLREASMATGLSKSFISQLKNGYRKSDEGWQFAVPVEDGE